ncbi:MAG: hypothetical protein N3G20_05520 [Verrucomicrobiae bacterium]|nr:hypothetical protein [Verrucomicrobiae bacterium]
MNTKLILVAVWIGVALVLGADAADSITDRAKKALDRATYSHFSREIKDRYPKEIAAYAIVEATVTRIVVDVYCPKSGALCGPNPACKHDKVTVQALDLEVHRVLFTTGPFNWPDKLLRYPAYTQGLFAEGEKVQVSLYGYRTGSTGIGTFRHLASNPPQKTSQ